jgi:hypothetical protein
MSEQFSGRVIILDSQGREVFAFDSQFAVLDIGALGNEGDLRLRGNDGESKIHLDGGRQLLNITNEAGVTVFRFDASHSVLDLGPSLGGQGAEADLRIFGADGQAKIHLDGNTGDIRLIGADCAEEFDIDESQVVEPGSVMTIGEEGRLRSCTEAYDRRVAGVVSGAGSYHSGIVMDSRHGRFHRTSVALTGKVYCRIDAEHCPIEVGDLLTTSRTVGHAMKATDPSRAFGATLGKALEPLTAGTGLIPILVALQ